MPQFSEFSTEDLQEIVFISGGSKKSFFTYVGLEGKEAEAFWIEHLLKTSIDWLRNLPRDHLYELLVKFSSMEKMANYYGCSEASVKKIFDFPRPELEEFSSEELEEHISYYGSIALAARCLKQPESYLRKLVKEMGIPLASLLDYSQGRNANAKGRRAELWFSGYREDTITKDMNAEEGSQADYDFEDKELGRVNVKSSIQFTYKARTRKNAPHYWKFSARGKQNADYFACICYNDKMTEVVGLKIVPTSEIQSESSFVLGQEEIEWLTS